MGAGLLYLTKRRDILIPHYYHFLILLLPPNTVGARSKRQHQASSGRGTVNWIRVLKTNLSLLMTVPPRLLWRPNPQAFHLNPVMIHLTNSTANLGRIREILNSMKSEGLQVLARLPMVLPWRKLAHPRIPLSGRINHSTQ